MKVTDDILDDAARLLAPRLSALAPLTTTVTKEQRVARRPCFVCQSTVAAPDTIVVIDALKPHQTRLLAFTLCLTDRTKLLGRWHTLGRRLTLYGFPVLAIDPRPYPANTIPPKPEEATDALDN